MCAINTVNINKAQIKYKAAARVAERLLKKTDNKVEKEILKHQHGYGFDPCSNYCF